MRRCLAALAIFAASPCAAQQADQQFLNRAIQALQTQRNGALDAQATAEARLSLALDEVTQLKDRVRKLEGEKAAPPAKE